VGLVWGQVLLALLYPVAQALLWLGLLWWGLPLLA
tara:strand:+ start:2557 stop:2661 length:105 start_codon:yes stop_codon:yes gene_type:complete